jgi:hypothetical protein
MPAETHRVRAAWISAAKSAKEDAEQYCAETSKGNITDIRFADEN